MKCFAKILYCESILEGRWQLVESLFLCDRSFSLGVWVQHGAWAKYQWKIVVFDTTGSIGFIVWLAAFPILCWMIYEPEVILKNMKGDLGPSISDVTLFIHGYQLEGLLIPINEFYSWFRRLQIYSKWFQYYNLTLWWSVIVLKVFICILNLVLTLDFIFTLN